MATITTFEHAYLTQIDFPIVQDFDWLIEQNFNGFSVERKNKQWRIKVGHYIGVIGLPSGYQVEILPKLVQKTSQSDDVNIEDTRQWLQQMFIDIWQTLTPKSLPNLANQQAINIQPNLPLSDWLTHQFWQLFHNYQPNQHYHRHEQNQPFLQGKLLIKEQLQHNIYQPHKFFHQVEYFVQDTACNRLVKTTLQTVIAKFNPSPLPTIWQAIPTLSPSQYQRCSYQANQELQALPQIIGQYNRQLIEFCYVLLTLQQATGQATGERQTHSPTLLINLQFAFEKWVSFNIHQSFANTRNCTEIVEQKSQYLTIDGRLTIKPDIWLMMENKTIVADIKWKNVQTVKDISLADMYQLLTYASEFQANEAWLIVPTLDKTLPKQPIIMANPKPTNFWLVPFCVSTAKLNFD